MHVSRLLASLSLVAMPLALACSDDLAATDNTPGAATPLPEGTFAVDASSDSAQVRFDLDTGKVQDEGWDLSFKRYQITTNGGESGGGQVVAVALPEVAFDDVVKAPDSGWVADAEDGSDEGAEPDTAFLGATAWYRYDPATHVLTPRDVVYVVRTTGGAYVKVAIVGYYDDAGTAGMLTFRVAGVAPPAVAPVTDPGADGTDGFVDGLVDGASDSADGLSDGTDGTDGVSDGTGGDMALTASDATTWTRLVLATGDTSVVDDLAAEGEWDVAFQRTAIRCNGGVSGAGMGAAVRLDGSYDDVVASPTWGFEADALVPNPGPPGSGESPGNPVLAAWYDYDPTTHAVSPKDDVYALRAADGSAYYKLAITGWQDGVYVLRVAEVPRDTSAVEAVVDASDAGVWQAFSVRTGALVAVDELATSLDWDVAFSGAMVRTNSGTSGPGLGGAAPVEGPLDALNEVTAAPMVDALAPLPGPPGAGETSQSGALSTWYDYDPATHALSPKDLTFALWTADGDLAALRFEAYASGVYTLRWRYAGLGQSGL